MSAEVALAYAHSKLGVFERPANSNKGPGTDGITAWQVASGYPWVVNAEKGVSWCQCWANRVAVAGGAPQLMTGYTVYVMRGLGNFKPVSVDDAEPGDFVFYKWPNVSHDICDHVGVLVSKTATTVTCIEGNTSPTDEGSQNNGGGVYLKTRSRVLVVGAASVPYPDRPAYRNLTLENPALTGSDIEAFQVAINKRADGCNRPDRRVTVDREYGSQTKENGAWAAFILGIGDGTEEIKSGGISPYVQNLVRNPDDRNDAQKERAGSRRQLYCR